MQEFKDSHINAHEDLTITPASNRNKTVQNHLNLVTRCENEGTLRFTNLGILTLVWRDNFDASVGSFQSQCSYLKPTYSEILQERLIDVGFHGKWQILEYQ